MKAFKVLVVDDSPFMRKLVGDLIADDPAFEVVATAADGAEAVRQVCGLHPEIVVMDLEMPEINGLEALKLIMQERPTPVIMMSAVTDRGTRDTIRALQFGAFDFVRKPDGALRLDVSQMSEMLLEKLHIARELLASGELRLRRMTEEGAEALVIQSETAPLPHAAERDASLPPPDSPQADAPSLPALQAGEDALHSSSAASDEAPDPPMISDFRAPVSRPTEDVASAKGEIAASADKPPSPVRPPGLSASSGKLAAPKPPTRSDDLSAARNNGAEPGSRITAAVNDSTRERAVPGAKLPKPPKSAKPDTKDIGRQAGRTEAPTAAAPPKPSSAASKPAASVTPRLPETFTDIVAIGTSTGGPRALHEVLSAIPASFPAPILIVQHMPPKFTHSLAQRLDSCSAIGVREAADGDPVLPGQAYLAPGGKHLKLVKDTGGGYRISLSEEDQVSGHRPSVDVMFGSLIGRGELRRHIVLMTGMGSDGAKAMKALREDGADTLIAEAEETCVVYGMPRSAVENGAAQKTVPLQRIAPELVRSVDKQKAKQL
ncbi:chemotaxis protein CheB [Cohnella sp. JJ-181]|uniref:chemotaxis protein CheB n=1 Tax=Cohnella rhizoplanae TaxID=2974897 RepID=UPI0022FF713A|nr:chemotaxis protein CheB [Cohnella sp. JJ-181]CAI6027256.1 Protein-glutamate methylesterase/protein-glutamine glutaminase [Cohnella sp. JJ-181]